MDEGETGTGAPAEPAVISLDEYMNKKEKAKTGLPTAHLRKAGEGEGTFATGKLGKKIQKHKEPKQVWNSVVLVIGVFR